MIRLLTTVSLICALPAIAAAERICVEEAAGVCLKYRTVEPQPAPSTRSRSETPQPQPQRPASPEARTEASLSLTRTELREVQGGLRKAGLYDGPLDGVLGGGSRGALRRWQAQTGHEPTGYLTFDQVLALQDAARGRARPAAPAVPAPAPAPQQAPEQEPEQETAQPPSEPLPGKVYSKVWSKSIAFAVGDMTATLKRLSDEKAELEVEYEPVNQRQFRFRDDCEVPLTGAFSCELRGFEGQLLFVNGELPDVHIDGRDIAFW